MKCNGNGKKSHNHFACLAGFAIVLENVSFFFHFFRLFAFVWLDGHDWRKKTKTKDLDARPASDVKVGNI